MPPFLRADQNLLVWGSEGIETNTLMQAANAASLPFVEGHVALMPDAHFGYGSTVGSVIPTKGAIIPSAIGVDIGCGMIAARLHVDSNGLGDGLAPLLSRIEQVVPAGVGKGHTDDRPIPYFDSHEVVHLDEEATARKQMGSLGSGNHFVEVCLDETDQAWVVLHSGSRGVGNRIATRHIEGAKTLMKRYFIDLPDPDLAYLVEGTPEFDLYIKGMLWAQEYAMLNRAAMMREVVEQIKIYLGWDPTEPITSDTINCHHNFTQRENHRGQNVWLTRKGAIQARKGDRGVIPGSMGTRSYIVRGLGHKGSYDSCSHGAGRTMARGHAKRTLSVDAFKASMVGKAWQDDMATALLDEAPEAYKDIDQVMEAQRDLVEIEHTLSQVLNYKGT